MDVKTTNPNQDVARLRAFLRFSRDFYMSHAQRALYIRVCRELSRKMVARGLQMNNMITVRDTLRDLDDSAYMTHSEVKGMIMFLLDALETVFSHRNVYAFPDNEDETSAGEREQHTQFNMFDEKAGNDEIPF